MDEKRKILEMVAEEKISAEEAAKLLEALNPAPAKPATKGKKLIFQIIQEGIEKPKVNIAIPLKLAKFGMSFIPKNGKLDTNISGTNIDLSSINWKEIMEMAASGEMGELLYMEVEDEGKTVIIRVVVE
ncbi:MAG: hypothetical protein K9N09_09155 [Candidatus Cloacimonetes bacterium]|nr:hypothetical protein [Candidatus Cloacimonadota bacterium]MCF7814196.1 hypothetical protein [Candidatus Cloacimonadota bacterium]MCF7868855.1 hypothetical protein [Candidatus Cloacimonadota bacterium]MCF7884252.1 hypothetical protein [Candidatus Cloacimonadota bacterium]